MVIYEMIDIEAAINVQRIMKGNEWQYTLLTENWNEMHGTNDGVDMNDRKVATSVVQE